MEHIRLEIEQPLQPGHLWDCYFAGRKVCALDIETTGLDRRRCRFILGGLYDPGEGVLHQIFAEEPAEEAKALAAFMELVRRFDVVMTYNGRHFDMPFLAERIRASGAGQAGVQPYDGYDMDLYQVVNGHSPIRRLLPNLKQKTVEAYMGLWTDRSDEISGAESVELYYHYAATKDPQARRQILLHNSDDVLQLTRLAEVIKKSDFHKAMYHMGFPAGAPARRWQVRRIHSVGDLLCVEGIQGADPIEYRGFMLGDYPLHTRFDAKAGTFLMEVPILRRSGIVLADLEAIGLTQKDFIKYPGYGSGFLVLEEPDGVKYREVNHLVTAMIGRLEDVL